MELYPPYSLSLLLLIETIYDLVQITRQSVSYSKQHVSYYYTTKILIFSLFGTTSESFYLLQNVWAKILSPLRDPHKISMRG